MRGGVGSFRGLSGLLLAVACGACGGGDAPQTELTKMGAETHSSGENRAPVIRELRLDPDQPASGAHVVAHVTVRDPEGDPVQIGYRWMIDGEPVPGGAAEIDLRGVPKGASVAVSVSASDGEAHSEEARAEVVVIDRLPVLEGMGVTPPETVPPGETVVVAAPGSDPDGDRVTFEYEWTVNGEATDDVGNTFETGSLRHGDEIVVRVWANDGANRSLPLVSAPVRVGSAHPEIVSAPPGFRDDGVFRYTVKAKDPDGDRMLRYHLGAGPEGMTIDEILGDLAWRPTDVQTGVHPVSIVVRDSTGLETTQSFEVTVNRADAPPAAAE
jgi:hypothetical protein